MTDPTMPPGGCQRIDIPGNPPTVIWVCRGDLEARYFELLAIEQEADWRKNQHEMDLGDVEDHQHIEVDFCRQRVDTDPHYVETWFEEADRDLALEYDDVA